MHMVSIALAFTLAANDPNELADPHAWMFKQAAFDPLGWELERFPSPHEVDAELQSHLAHSKWLEVQSAFDPTLYIDWDEDMCERGVCWELLREAQNRHNWLETRIIALDELKVRIKRENYNLGRMPPSIPIWRFQARGPSDLELKLFHDTLAAFERGKGH